MEARVAQNGSECGRWLELSCSSCVSVCVCVCVCVCECVCVCVCVCER